MRVIGIFLLSFVAPAIAQAPPKPEPLELPRVPVAPPGGIELKALPVPAAPLVVAAPVFVKSFRILGSPTFETELATLLAPWTGRSLSAEELQRAADAATAHLRKRGFFVGQAFLPPQQIRDGVVEMQILEGRIGAMRLDVAPDSRVRPSVAERFVADLRAGETIRRDNVEQSLLLLNDLPGVALSASLAPGSETGTADLSTRLQNEGNPIDGRLTLDNAGVRGIGEYRGILDLRAPSPLGFGDLLAARLLRSSEGGHTFGSLTYGAPVNGAGTRLGIRYAEQSYKLGREFAALQAKGDSRAGTLLAVHPLVRRSDANLNLGASYSEVEYQDRIDAVGSVTDSRHRIASLGFAADSVDGWLGGGANYFQAQYFRGKVVLLDSEFAAFDSAPGGLGVAGMFSMWRLRAQRIQAVDAVSSLRISLNGQMASKNLDAGNEIQLGGPDAVRAYPVGEVYADEGYVARLEYRRDFKPFELPLTLGLFYDAAQAKINRDPPPGDARNRRNLSGYGIGAYLAPWKAVSVQTWFAWRA
ncbi:MAG TPA: ShlB/FhaC/HecB family hemolysin secretion/activation protein, partial [Burkholderiales bacterium]|nr:ShlB/FhaC/HecB family hemolysin secretion/activation protein [Burkholderiales bacterium]